MNLILFWAANLKFINYYSLMKVIDWYKIKNWTFKITFGIWPTSCVLHKALQLCCVTTAQAYCLCLNDKLALPTPCHAHTPAAHSLRSLKSIFIISIAFNFLVFILSQTKKFFKFRITPRTTIKYSKSNQKHNLRIYFVDANLFEKYIF